MNLSNIRTGRKAVLKNLLSYAREALNDHDVWLARWWLDSYHHYYAAVPASTKRRWKCGR